MLAGRERGKGRWIVALSEKEKREFSRFSKHPP
jgi:hypothetical protein